MAEESGYQGWRNYETWAVKLWIDNDEGSYDYWRDQTRECWETAGDKSPNQFMDRSSNARSMLAEALKNQIDNDIPEEIQHAVDGTMYADLLNAAISEVDWYEIADSMLRDLAENTDEFDDDGEPIEKYTNDRG